jgi:hypothetical protein
LETKSTCNSCIKYENVPHGGYRACRKTSQRGIKFRATSLLCQHRSENVKSLIHSWYPNCDLYVFATLRNVPASLSQKALTNEGHLTRRRVILYKGVNVTFQAAQRWRLELYTAPQIIRPHLHKNMFILTLFLQPWAHSCTKSQNVLSARGNHMTCSIQNTY